MPNRGQTLPAAGAQGLTAFSVMRADSRRRPLCRATAPAPRTASPIASRCEIAPRKVARRKSAKQRTECERVDLVIGRSLREVLLHLVAAPAGLNTMPCRRLSSLPGRIRVQTHQINVSRAREMVQEIRLELFKFPEVLDVFVTGRPDGLVVVSRGRPRPAEWLLALRAVGYHMPVRRHAKPAAQANRQRAIASRQYPSPSISRASPRRSAPLRTHPDRADVRGATRRTMTGSAPLARTEERSTRGSDQGRG
jgi:hypothetical protein